MNKDKHVKDELENKCRCKISKYVATVVCKLLKPSLMFYPLISLQSRNCPLRKNNQRTWGRGTCLELKDLYGVLGQNGRDPSFLSFSDWLLGEQQKESGIESEAAGAREGPAAAQKFGEPPEGRERGRQEALPGERRYQALFADPGSDSSLIKIFKSLAN